jgi:IS5 family transposase
MVHGRPPARPQARSQLGPEVIRQIHDRIVSIAKEKGLAQGTKMRVDTTVIETNIH